MDEKPIKPKLKLPLELSLKLLSKHMKNKNISDSILKLVENINISLFKYINKEKNNQKAVELKLVYINNIITDKLYKDNKQVKSFNLSAKATKRNCNLLITENNKNNINSNIYDDINNSNFIRIKMKRKLKNEHDKFKIKELEYLQRISELQSKINTYESIMEKIISENNEFLNNLYIESNSNNDINKRDKRINSSYILSIKDPKIYNKYSNIKNKRNNSSLSNMKINKFYHSENTSMDNNAKKIKGKIIEKYNKKYNLNASEIYFNSNYNLNKGNNMSYKQLFSKGLNDLNFKYQVGNGYLRNNFFMLKKEIKEQTNHYKKIKNTLNHIK